MKCRPKIVPVDSPWKRRWWAQNGMSTVDPDAIECFTEHWEYRKEDLYRRSLQCLRSYLVDHET